MLDAILFRKILNSLQGELCAIISYHLLGNTTLTKPLPQDVESSSGGGGCHDLYLRPLRESVYTHEKCVLGRAWRSQDVTSAKSERVIPRDAVVQPEEPSSLIDKFGMN